MKYTLPLLPRGGIFRSCAVALLFCFIAPSPHAQSPALIYAKALNNSVPLGGFVVNKGIAVDASGNTYIAGSFQYNADFDPGVGTAGLTTVAGSEDTYIAKYDASGAFVWAKSIGGSNTDVPYGIALDASSNIYITGYFAGTSDFDPGTGTASLTSAGGFEIFLAKYDASGAYVWAKAIGGTGNEIAYAIALDASSNAYITGYFTGTADFDPGAGTANLSSVGNNDIFLAKYNSSGVYQYAKAMGGTTIDIGNGIAVDAAANVYITGQFTGTADFDPAAGTQNLTSAGLTDIFIAKYNATGLYSYAGKIGGTTGDIGYGIAVDGSSNAYITGQFTGTSDFDPAAATQNLISAGSTDVFLAKYNSTGLYSYAKRLGGSSGDVGYALTLDGSANAYVTGQFAGTADFDPGASTVNLVSNGGTFDLFVAKYDVVGNYAYAAAMGGTTNDDFGYAIDVDGSANAYTTGLFRGTVDFDPGAGTANLVSGTVQRNGFVLKLNNTAAYVWAVMQGGYSAISSDEQGRSTVVDASGNTYVTGYFVDIVDFDPGAGTANLTSAGGADIFIAKYNAAGSYLWAKAIGGTTEDAGFAVALDGSSNVYLTGYFDGTVDFDPGAGTANLTGSGGGNDIFIAKYTASGNYVYAKGMVGTGLGYAIAVDASSNTYITGQFNGTVDFDPGAGTANVTGAGSADIFLAKYDASGNYVYAKGMGNTANDIGYAIALDGSANVYITGQFANTVDFDPGAGTVNLTSAFSTTDIFFAKYTAAGIYVYAKAVGSTGDEAGRGIGVDASSNVYITGYFPATVDFDPGAGTVSLTSAGSFDIFLAKYNSLGNYVYAKRMGGPLDDIGYGIAVDGSNTAYLTGQFTGTADFDPGAGTANLISAGSSDLFFAKYDVSGNYVYANGIGSTGDDVGHGIDVDATSNVYLTGTFLYTADFYPAGGSSASIITANNSADIFIAAYGNPIPVPLRFESIAARVVNNEQAVQIDWSAALQINNDYFEVQRSKDGIDFETVSQVPGCLWCGELQQYTATDNEPLRGTSFYRIKQVDTDGKASYSTTVRVTLGKSPLTSLNLYPTVTHNAFSVRVQNKGVEKSALMQIWSAEGKLARQQTILLHEGDNRFSFSLAGEARGVYYVRLISPSENTSSSAGIIKQ